MAELKDNERIYTIPLREAYKKAAGKRVPYAARLVRAYLKQHTKAETIKLGKELNKALWSRGIKKPPRRLRVKASKDGKTVKAEIVGFEYEEFKAQPRTEKKGLKEKLAERLGPKALQKEKEEKMIEGKEETTEDKKETKAEAKNEQKEEKETKNEAAAEKK